MASYELECYDEDRLVGQDFSWRASLIANYTKISRSCVLCAQQHRADVYVDGICGEILAESSSLAVIVASWAYKLSLSADMQAVLLLNGTLVERLGRGWGFAAVGRYRGPNLAKDVKGNDLWWAKPYSHSVLQGGILKIIEENQLVKLISIYFISIPQGMGMRLYPLEHG